MIEIAALIFFTVAIVLAWKVSTSEDMIFESVGNFAQNKIDGGSKVYELIYCPWCMPTIFTFFAWGFMASMNVVNEFHWYYIAVHIISWFSSCFLCGIIWTAYLTLNAKKEYYEAAKGYYENAEILSHFDIKDRKENHFKKQNKNNGVKDY